MKTTKYVMYCTQDVRICLPCWMGELRVDPVLPLDPYFSSSSANSFLFGGKFWKRAFHSWTGRMDAFKSNFIDQGSVRLPLHLNNICSCISICMLSLCDMLLTLYALVLLFFQYLSIFLMIKQHKKTHFKSFLC